MQPDSNDIIYDGYSLDVVAIGRALYELFGGQPVTYDQIVAFITTAWGIFTITAFLLAFLFFVGLVYAYIRANQMGELEDDLIAQQERLYRDLFNKGAGDTRWMEIQQHIGSDNPNDWKLAIIEADIILGEALDKEGYAGTTIGDQLKSVSPSVMQTLDDAWEAHKVRNNIAHQGADFVLTKKAAQDALVRYGRVFQELKVI